MTDTLELRMTPETRVTIDRAKYQQLRAEGFGRQLADFFRRHLPGRSGRRPSRHDKHNESCHARRVFCLMLPA